MLKKDTLYTANKWNQPLFTGEKAVPSPAPNLYEGGGLFNPMLDRWASKAYGERYGDRGYTLADYKADLGSQLGAAATVASPFLSEVIGGGYSTGGVGEGIATVGNTVGEFMPDPISKAAVKVGSAVVGGVVNRTFGTKKNEKNINRVNENIANMRTAGNALASAKSSNSFLDAAGMMSTSSGFGTKDLVKGGIFAKGKAKKMGQKYLDKEDAALAYQTHGLTTGAEQVDRIQDDAIMSNFAAFGGPLGYPQETGMGAIDYGFMSDYSKYLMTKGKQNQGKSGVDSFTAPSILALGGPKGGDGKTYKGKTVPYLARRGWPSSIAGIDAMRKAGFTDAEIDDWMINHQGATGYKRLTDGKTEYRQGPGAFGEGDYSGGGYGMRWNPPYQPKNTTNFNEAFDEARKAGAEDFWFGGKRYNTIMEANPIREFNNRHVGAGRTPEQIEKREGYGRDYGPINNKYAALPIIPYAEGGPLFALGGDIQRGGADYTTGLAHVDAGGSHEENPYQGVQMGVDSEGVPNLVEEGEVVFNDYVYSKRITLDEEAKKKFHFPKKKELSYADAAKMLEKEISERPNDPISKAAFKAQMETLANEQERQKQEMEAARAREAFEALSPEEQSALMQQVAQQEQMAQEQAIQEQAMAAQQAQEQPMPVNPEEMAMVQQEAPIANAMGTVAEPQMACGGKLRKYDRGGELRKKIFDLLGLKSMEDWHEWAKKNKIESGNADVDKAVTSYIAKHSGAGDVQEGDVLDGVNWRQLLANPTLKNALAKDNPALAHALGMGYDWGLYTPTNTGGVTFPTITQGNWENQTYEGWKDSQDPGWLEAVENWKKELGDNWADTVKGYNREQIADALRKTQAFQRGTKWLQDDEANRLRYLTELYTNADTPEKARKYAEKFIEKDANGNIVWKADAKRDYDTIFNNPSGRAANPGTYWHTPLEAVRDKLVRNYVQNDKGEWEELIGSTDDLEAAGSYNWADTKGDYTNNYYIKKGAGANGKGKAPGTGEGDEDYEWEVSPNYKNDKLRYAGILGPAIGLGMQALGIGRPDTKKLEGVLDMYNKQGAVLGDYMPIGNYLRYTPMDIWAEQNRMHSNARAADRAVLNSGAVQGSKMAGILANEYNNQVASGDLYRKALEYNDALRERTAAFNKDTDKFNADAYNRLSLQNAEIMNRDAQMKAQLGMQAASQKLDADAGWYNGIYGNVGGIFKGLSDIGRENAQHNMIAEMAANGIFGKTSPKTHVGRRDGYLIYNQVPKKK